jgi:hypothetical protein
VLVLPKKGTVTAWLLNGGSINIVIAVFALKIGEGPMEALMTQSPAYFRRSRSHDANSNVGCGVNVSSMRRGALTQCAEYADDEQSGRTAHFTMPESLLGLTVSTHQVLI